MLDDKHALDRAALGTVIDALKELDDDVRERLIRTIITFYNIQLVNVDDSSRSRPWSNAHAHPTAPEWPKAAVEAREPRFGTQPDLSPKEFMHERQPRTDIERVACLAYYLAHYRDVPHFKTVDISKLNTEAAQLKFSNTAYAVANAERKGLLTSAVRGMKQLSAVGEQFVVALPDRDNAKKVLERVRKRRSASGKRGAKAHVPEDED